MTQYIYTNQGKDSHGPLGDTQMVCTTKGEKQANAVVAATQASLNVPGVDTNGDVTYKALGGGTWGDSITIEHATGDTGAGHEDRTLAVATTGYVVTVTFGTDGSGNSVTPTGTAVKDLVNADADASLVVIASTPGTGASNSATIVQTYLAGGLDDGDYLCIQSRWAMMVSRREAS